MQLIEELDSTSLVANARVESGTRRELPAGLLPRVEAWVRALNAVPLTPMGRMAQEVTARRLLVNRLRFEDAVERHPEILAEDVSDPIVIVGFPRSGTTALQRMMSADPAVQRLDFWRALNPAPFPGETRGERPAERIAFGLEVEAAMKQHSPALFAAHPSVALDAEEDWFLHHLDFAHVANFCLGPLTDEYIAYLGGLPRQPTYTFAADVLRFLQWQDGGRRDRPWVLKSPAHIGYIDEMLAAHPRATFVYPRRDFETVMASFCYTLEMSLSTGWQPDPLHIGRASLAFWLGEMERFYASRARLGDRLRLIELPYQDMLRDPVAHIRQVHELAGRSLGAEGAAAIERWVRDNPPGKHGKNVYSLERYGLDRDQVAAAFAKF